MSSKFLLPFLLLAPFLVTAQSEFNLATSNLWQSNEFNPAQIPEARITVALPSLGFSLAQQGTTYSNLVPNAANQYDFTKAVAQLQDINQLHLDNRVTFWGAGFKYKQLFVGINQSIRSNIEVQHPKALLDMVWNGNGQYIGQKADLAPSLNSLIYNELGLNLAYTKSKITIGGRVKFLTGMHSIVTNAKNSATLFTNPDIYQLSFETDYQLQTANSLDYSSGVNFQPKNFNLTKFALGGKNTGLAFDLGMTFHPSEKWSLGISFCNLGKITWNDTKNYASKGTYKFEGVKINNLTQDTTLSFGNLLDTLKTSFQFKTTNEAYSTTLPYNYYLTYNYKFKNTWQLSAIASLQSHTHTAFALNVSKDFGKFVTLGLGGTVTTLPHFGVNALAVLHLGPVQVFGSTNSVLNLFNAADTPFSNGRVGVNVVFK
jgi:hypothetical protein